MVKICAMWDSFHMCLYILLIYWSKDLLINRHWWCLCRVGVFTVCTSKCLDFSELALSRSPNGCLYNPSNYYSQLSASPCLSGWRLADACMFADSDHGVLNARQYGEYLRLFTREVSAVFRLLSNTFDHHNISSVAVTCSSFLLYRMPDKDSLS